MAAGSDGRHPACRHGRRSGHKLSRWWRITLRVGTWGMLIGIYSLVAFGGWFLLATLQPYRLSNIPSPAPAEVYSSDGVLLGKLDEGYRVPVVLGDIPTTTLSAVLAAEDIRFFSHRGLDLRGILRALWIDIRARALLQGGSTITQQLVRLAVLNPKRSWHRKINEAVLAVRLERGESKHAILESYLNTVYFGGGAYGIGAAANSYFRKSVSALTPAESALLAALIREPSGGNPRVNFPLAQRRQRQILAIMHTQGWLTTPAYQQALQEKIDIHPSIPLSWQAPYALQLVRQQLIAQFGRAMLLHGGLRVEVSINSVMQRATEQALAQAVADGRSRGVGNGALVAIDPHTGDITALVGGIQYQQSQFNRAVQAHRQPGSAFKVFVYQAALERGHLLSDIARDSPITIGHWSPANFGNEYYGAVTLQTALAHSLNSVAVRLTQEATPTSVIAAAHRAGINSELRTNLTIALGASEVTPWEMARAFATYANSGGRSDPRVIRQVYQHGQLRFQQPVVIRTTVKPAIAFLLTQGLQQVISSGTGRRAEIGRPAAGKTGTSSDFRDAWFVGYTPDLCAAVWLGQDARRPMQGITGGTLPAQAWATFMRTALRDVPPTPFSPPPTVRQATICAQSHLLALPPCPHPLTVYLPVERIPTLQCTVHYWVRQPVCTVTGLLPNVTCPTEVRQFPYFSPLTARCTLDHRHMLPPPDMTAPPDTTAPESPLPPPPSPPDDAAN